MERVDLSFLTSVSLAGLAYLLAHVALARTAWLRCWHVPAPVLGGLGAALVLVLLWVAGINVEIPKSGRPVDFLVALLTTNMGLHLTPRVLREGIRAFPLFLGLGAAIFFLQLVLVFPFALGSADPLRAAIIMGPLSHVGIPFNLNPPSQLDPIRHLFPGVELQPVSRGLMMTGVLMGAVVTAVVGRRLFDRAGTDSPKPSPDSQDFPGSVWAFTIRETALLVLVLSLVSAAFLVQDALLAALPWLKEGYLPVIVLGYLFGAVFRLAFSAIAPEKFPEKALTALLYGPTMALVLTYALMSIPLHTLSEVPLIGWVASAVAVGASALVAWLAFPLFTRVMERYYAALLATVLLAITTGFGPMAMSFLRRFGHEDGPAEPVPVVLPLNAFFLFPWMVSLLTMLLLGSSA